MKGFKADVGTSSYVENELHYNRLPKDALDRLRARYKSKIVSCTMATPKKHSCTSGSQALTYSPRVYKLQESYMRAILIWAERRSRRSI